MKNIVKFVSFISLLLVSTVQVTAARTRTTVVVYTQESQKTKKFCANNNTDLLARATALVLVCGVLFAGRVVGNLIDRSVDHCADCIVSKIFG